MEIADKKAKTGTRAMTAVQSLVAVALVAVASVAIAQADAAVTTVSVDRFEAVATGASTGIAATIPNIWGGHQPRITRHADGTTRIVYITADATAVMTWHLMRRAPTGGWSEEASGPSTDDVGLLRDPRDDRAYVVAWPNSVPTVYTGPDFKPAPIPGSWQVLPSKYRQYGNVGVGTDGTVCIKASREINVAPVTSQDKTEYSCGKYDATTKVWTWGPLISHYIGLRHVYDYLFPNPKGAAPGLYGASRRDLYKTASNVPLLDPALAPYVYNGTRVYKSGLYEDSAWVQADAVQQIYAPVGATRAPMAKLTDAYMDSKGRMFLTYHKEDPLDSTVYGTYLTVTDVAGNVLYSAKWPPIVELYGSARIFEDGKNRLWLMWSNRGNRTTEVRVYPITETAAPLKFSVSTYTDISKATYPYAMDGTLFIAAPRGGSAPGVYVDVMMNACTTTFTTGIVYDNSACYGTDNNGLGRVMYMRVRLPD